MEKLVVCIMGQNCEKFIGMCLDGVKEADAIVYCDGGSTDNTLKITQDFLSNNPQIKPSAIIQNPYDQEDKGMNGKQRNFYLKYLKENYPDHWCLAIDADEAVEDISKVKEFINNIPPGVYSPKMRHLIGDLAHEDSTQPIHFVLHRLFKISNANFYPEVEHPVLVPTDGSGYGGTDCTTIWHLAYIKGMFDIKKKYENHLKKSEMHTKDYLRGWYFSHLFGTYKTQRFNAQELPDSILKGFGLPKDEIYFIGRGNMEVKHYQDAINWKNFFKLESCIIFGCGLGQRVYTLNNMGVNTLGIELSEYAVKQRLHENIMQGDITEEDLGKGQADLSVAFDVLEHLNYGEDLEKAINNLISHTKKHILISVPVIGNPALDIDKTHIIRESEEWWIKQFTDKGLKLIKTPDNFLYKEQVYIFEK